jgi:predicted transcriptional regulator YdeE
MADVQEKTLPLTLEAEAVQFPSTHYVFIEKRGSIPANAAQAWSELHTRLPTITEHNTVAGFLSLYRMDEGIYRAGVALDAAPRQLPAGLQYERFAGGKYRKFVLKGSYSQLPQATGQAVRTVRESQFQLRNDFNIERYVNDPRSTPEDQLLTEILFPAE